MTLTPDPEDLFSVRHLGYARFIRLMRYPQGLRAFFLASPLLQSDMRVLDAGCGTGALLLGLREAFFRRGLTPAALHAFDLTPAMLDHFRHTLQRCRIDEVELARANVLRLDELPDGWRDYDLIVSASMLEYVPRERFVDALRGLRDRLRDGGTLVLFMTRRNPLTRLLVGRLWKSNLYRADELTTAFRAAGFSNFQFRTFPPSARHMGLWGYVVGAALRNRGAPVRNGDRRTPRGRTLRIAHRLASGDQPSPGESRGRVIRPAVERRLNEAGVGEHL